jgi:hypothetical protein
MSEKEQHDVVTRAAESPMHKETVEEVTPEQQEWLRLAGFSRKEWQRLVYARWRYRQGMLSDDPHGSR